MILDPFYGVFKVDTEISKWMNRILLSLELVILFYSIKILWFSDDCLSYWNWESFLYTICLVIALAIFNSGLRKLCDFILVIIYGTTDADVILQDHNRRQEKRRARKMARQMRREARAHKRTDVLLPSEISYPKWPRE